MVGQSHVGIPSHGMTKCNAFSAMDFGGTLEFTPATLRDERLRLLTSPKTCWDFAMVTCLLSMRLRAPLLPAGQMRDFCESCCTGASKFIIVQACMPRSPWP